MKIQTTIIILILLSLLSCGNHGNKATSLEKLNGEKENKLRIDQEVTNPGEYFAKSILEINLGKTITNSAVSENPKYNQLFRKEGIKSIVAYFDKSANQPTNFKDFLLFVASYDNSYNAKSAFERIKSDAELSNSAKNLKLDQEIMERIELLRLGDKYGGLITYNGNQVFSLIENCDKLPTGKNWLELEYKLTDLLKNEHGYVEVLKAGCEEGRYYGGRRIVSS